MGADVRRNMKAAAAIATTATTVTPIAMGHVAFGSSWQSICAPTPQQGPLQAHHTRPMATTLSPITDHHTTFMWLDRSGLAARWYYFFLGAAFLVAGLRAAGFLAGARRAGFLAGPLARLSASSSTARSGVSVSTVSPRGIVTLVVPSVM